MDKWFSLRAHRPHAASTLLLLTGLTTACGQGGGAEGVDSRFGGSALSLTEGVYEIVNVNSGKALTPEYDLVTDGASMHQWDNYHGDIEHWNFHNLGDGTYEISNFVSGEALDIAQASTSDGARLVQNRYADASNQKWQIADGGNGAYKIINKRSGRVLDVANASIDNGGKIIQYVDWNGANQKWRLLLVGSADTKAPATAPTPAPTAPAPAPTAGPPAAPAAATPTGVPAGYQLVFSDDFEGASLDTSKWQIGWAWGRTAGAPNDQYYVGDDNVRVAGGALHLTGKQESIGGKQYSAGMVNLSKGLTRAYGYYEARIKTADGTGLSSAFWLKESTNAWPPEQDIVEAMGRAGEHQQDHQTLHYADSSGNHQYDSVSYATPFDTTADFHTYGYLWAPEKNCWYVDGVETLCLSGNSPSTSAYIILNLGIPDWYGMPDSTTPFPGSMDVDWVHVYARP